MDIAYNVSDSVYNFVIENCNFHFSIAKTDDEKRLANQLYRDTIDFSEFRKILCDHFSNIDIKQLEEEYSYVGLVASSISNYHRYKSKTELFPFWKYSRIEHTYSKTNTLMLDGIILPHDDIRWNYIYPVRDSVIIKMDHECERVDFEKMRNIADKYIAECAIGLSPVVNLYAQIHPHL